MRVVVTGGGTGGHVYPALEVARYAREKGAELLYLGSLRGQEGRACEREGILFTGFDTYPLVSLKTPAGWKAALSLVKATGAAKARLKAAAPDIVFSTGGYSSAPVVSAARTLGIPYVLFAADSVPGRTQRLFAKQARAVATAFKSSAGHLPGANVIRTGAPIRKALREAALATDPGRLVMVIGGSQGAKFLNDTVPLASRLVEDARWLHATGPKNYQEVRAKFPPPDGYDLQPYLEADQIIEGYQRAGVCVARSGGTVSEFALFGIPSVLIPLPTSADDHQLHNAREFESMEAATVIEQKNATPEAIATAVQNWLDNAPKRERAQAALRAWNVPDATERIYALLVAAKEGKK